MDAYQALTEPVLERARLLARLAGAHPKIVALIAPAGFGKSTLAAQFSTSASRAAVCDCSWVDDSSSFLRAVLAALAKESPELNASMATTQVLIADKSRTPTERLELTLERWTALATPSIFTFENVERIASFPDVLAVLWRFLAALPSHRSIIICSRPQPAMHLTRFAAPHEIIALDAADLAFDRDEMDAVLRNVGLEETELDRVITLSRGWPIAALMLARSARENRLDESLRTLAGLPAGDGRVLQSYVVEEALGFLSPRGRELLGACALLPSPDALEISIATGEEFPADVVSNELATMPFLRMIEDDRYELHPLIQGALLADRREQRYDLLQRVARELVVRERFPRAAFLFLESGDQRSAADALARVDALMQQRYPVEYVGVLTRLDSETVAAYPALWFGTIFARLDNVDQTTILHEAQAYWLRFTSDTALNHRAALLAALALLLSEDGRHIEARDAIEMFYRESGCLDCPEIFPRASLLHAHAAVLARLGNLSEAETCFDAALPLVSGRHVSLVSWNANRAIHVERVLGRRDRERAMLDNAILHAKQSQTTTLIARSIAEATFAAWLAGEEKLYAEYLHLLAEQVERHKIRGLRHFVACASGRTERHPVGIELPARLAEAHLIASTKAASAAAARHHVNAAVAAADRYNEPMLQVLTRIAVAQVDPARRERAAAEAVLFANRIASAPLNLAVERWSQGDLGTDLLTPFLAQLAKRRSASAARFRVALLAGRVSTIQGTVILRPREHELLFMLSAQRRPVSIGKLTASMWPDENEEQARNSLYVLLHRMRKRFGDSELIVHTPEGYAIDAAAVIDLWEAEDAYHDLRLGVHLDESGRERLRDMLELLRSRSAGRARARDWYGAFERRVNGLIRNIGLLLARNALKRGEILDAIALAEALIVDDPLDEEAREIAIHAHLQAGSLASVRREYRSYQEILMRELEVSPSEALQGLVAERAGMKRKQ
jgi:DNA-binding SARP family transcriptional activator